MSKWTRSEISRCGLDCDSVGLGVWGKGIGVSITVR